MQDEEDERGKHSGPEVNYKMQSGDKIKSIYFECAIKYSTIVYYLPINYFI